MPGFVGSFTYSQRNLFGLGQRLSALAELGQTDKVRRAGALGRRVLGAAAVCAPGDAARLLHLARSLPGSSMPLWHPLLCGCGSGG